MKKIDITVVDFSGGGDGITAMYINGLLNQYGDYYHNKIDETIGGFIEGTKYCLGEDNVIVNKINLHEDHPLVYSTWELAESPPSDIADIDENERTE